MTNYNIVKLSDLDKTYVEKTAKLFVDGFYDRFEGVSKDKRILIELFQSAIVSSMFYVCLDKGEVIGFIAYSNNERRAVCFDKEIFKSIFGKGKGVILWWQLNMIMGRPAVKSSSEGYIDFLATHINYRRKGVATLLLEYLYKDMNFESYELEVVSNNVNAIQLYEKLGFKTQKVKNNIFLKLSGLGSIMIMKK